MNKEEFQGFESPKENWSKLPHEFIAIMPEIETLGEMKVLIYTVRHTWGYRDDFKKITLDEYQYGRKRKDGTRIDNGTGLSKPTIKDGIKRAISHGFLHKWSDTSDAGRQKNYYSLESFEGGARNLPPGYKHLAPRDKEVCPRTEKETLERNLRDITLEKKSSVGASEKPKTQVVELEAKASPNVSETDVDFTCLDAVIAEYGEAVARAAAEKLDTLMTEGVSPIAEQEFDDFFEDNPRQDEIDSYKGKRLSKDELLLASMGVGVSSEIRSQIALMRDQGWNIRDSEVETLMAQFFEITGFVIPTDKSGRNFFASAVRSHKDNELFSGRVGELYQIVWDKVSEDYNSGNLELNSPKSFTNMMRGVINREQGTDGEQPLRTMDQIMDALQRAGLIEFGETSPGKFSRVWADTKKLVQDIPEDLLQKYSSLQ